MRAEVAQKLKDYLEWRQDHGITSEGLFVTTSSFSPAAKETADLLSKRIVLIDGHQLTRLMIRFGIGCRVEETIHIKKIDEEFFE